VVKVKICGITCLEDASRAAELGVDVLGFIFAPSPRQMTPEEVRLIICNLPPFVGTVGVFVNQDLETIRDIVHFCSLDMIQLHGNESPRFCQDLMPYTIKAFRLKDASGLSLDTYQEDTLGGTGKTFDWNLAIKAMELKIPLILSGGLNPTNIQKAIMTVNPYAVDVNSGIEERPGKKDLALMKALMEKIREIERGDLLDD
jgi:phosphoribosylanthranilate isomerase